MRWTPIIVFMVVLLNAVALQTAHAQDRPRRGSELMALLQLNCGDKVQEQNFRNALQAVPSSSLRRAEVLVLYSQCLFRTRQRESDAVPLLKEAVRILPSNAGVQRHLGYAYFRLGRDLEAIEAIERSLDLEPNAYTYGQLGFVLMRSVSGPLTGDRARKQRANVL